MPAVSKAAKTLLGVDVLWAPMSEKRLSAATRAEEVEGMVLVLRRNCSKRKGMLRDAGVGR